MNHLEESPKDAGDSMVAIIKTTPNAWIAAAKVHCLDLMFIRRDVSFLAHIFPVSTHPTKRKLMVGCVGENPRDAGDSMAAVFKTTPNARIAAAKVR